MNTFTPNQETKKKFKFRRVMKIPATFLLIFLLLTGGVNKSWGQNLYWNGSGTWNNPVPLFTGGWANNSGGDGGLFPYGIVWVNNRPAVFNVPNSTITGASINFSSITANENVTVTVGGTLGTGSVVAPITVANGKTFDFGMQLFSLGTGLIKEGAGTLKYGPSGGGAYTGGFTLNTGTVLLGGATNSLGAATLTINGGILAASATHTFSNSKFTTITIGGNFSFGDATNVSNINFGSSSSETATITLGTGTTRTITLAGTGTYTLWPVISGTGSNLTVAATEAGTLVLTGSNTYTGLTTVSGGTLQLNKPGGTTIPVTNNLTVTGGTLRISSNQAINNLMLVPGATLLVDNGVILTVNGTFNYNGGTITLTGTGAIAYGSSGILSYGGSSLQTPTASEFPVSGGPNDLTINNSAGVSFPGSFSRTVNGTLTLNSGALSIGSNTLTLNGPTTGSGTLTGTASAGVSTSNLVIGGAAGTINFTQTNASARSLNNLTLKTGGNVTLGTALDVYGTIELTSATLHVNAKDLTLKSNATNTARIANLTGSTLDGATNVTMERWIKLRAGGTGRAYRLLAPTVNTSGSIQLNWMEGGMNTSIGVNINPVPNYGTQISGPGGNANGFDVTQSNAASLFLTANGVTPTYTAVGSTTGTLNALTGYFLFLRGDRSTNMTLPLAIGMPTSSTTLRTKGTLVTGTQTIFSNTLIGGGALNLITNPYASPIDWSLVQPACTNISTSYTLWDPNFGTRGGFVTVNTSGIASSGLATKFIQPGQAFFVQASGGVPTVSIQEAHKTAGNNNEVFRLTTAVESFRTELYFTEPNGYRRIADGVIALYDNSYSPGIDADDAIEINNWDENIAISREDKRLAIESRPVIQLRDTLPLFMNNMKQKDYEFEFTPSLFSNGALNAELIDNFTGTRTLLSILTSTVVPFTVTADPASSATDRFKVVFGPSLVLAVDLITVKAYKKNQGVQVDWTARTESDMDHYEVERSATGSNFDRKTIVAALGNSNGAVNYSWFDANPERGNNFYRIKGVDKTSNTRYSAIVRVTVGTNEPGLVIYPNPVTGNSFTIELNNLIKGVYRVSLINNLGQQVLSTNIQHEGGSVTKTIPMPQRLPKGIYQLVLKTENGSGNNPINLVRQVIKN